MNTPPKKKKTIVAAVIFTIAVCVVINLLTLPNIIAARHLDTAVAAFLEEHEEGDIEEYSFFPEGLTETSVITITYRIAGSNVPSQSIKMLYAEKRGMWTWGLYDYESAIANIETIQIDMDNADAAIAEMEKNLELLLAVIEGAEQQQAARE